MDLQRVVRDLASCIQRIDARRPQAANSRTGVSYQAGIGPHPETQTVALIAKELPLLDAAYEGRIRLGVPYLDGSRQKCDLCLSFKQIHRRRSSMRATLMSSIFLLLCCSSVGVSPSWAADSPLLGTWKGNFVGSATSGLVDTILTVKDVDIEKKTASVKFYRGTLVRSPYPLEVEKAATLIDEKTLKLEVKDGVYTYTLQQDGSMKATRFNSADKTWTAILKKSE